MCVGRGEWRACDRERLKGKKKEKERSLRASIWIKRSGETCSAWIIWTKPRGSDRRKTWRWTTTEWRALFGAAALVSLTQQLPG